MRRFFALALSFALLSASAQAQVVRLRVGPDQSLKTVRAALEKANESGGDVVIALENGTPGEENRFRPAARLASLTIEPAEANVAVDGVDNKSTWLSVIATDGRMTHITLRGFTIKNYLTAVSISGDREHPQTGWNGGNAIEKMRFVNIGARGDGEPSTAVIRLVTSSKNVIRNNEFIDIGNDATCGTIHAVYLAHNSSGNIVENNKIVTRCMDPFRIRDRSDNNVFRNNIVRGHINNAIYTEWRCEQKCTKSFPECPSIGNKYENIHANLPGISVFKEMSDGDPASVSCKRE